MLVIKYVSYGNPRNDFEVEEEVNKVLQTINVVEDEVTIVTSTYNLVEAFKNASSANRFPIDSLLVLREEPTKCKHLNVDSWNHGYHSECLDCGETDVVGGE